MIKLNGETILYGSRIVDASGKQVGYLFSALSIEKKIYSVLISDKPLENTFNLDLIEETLRTSMRFFGKASKSDLLHKLSEVYGMYPSSSEYKLFLIDYTRKKGYKVSTRIPKRYLLVNFDDLERKSLGLYVLKYKVDEFPEFFIPFDSLRNDITGIVGRVGDFIKIKNYNYILAAQRYASFRTTFTVISGTVKLPAYADILCYVKPDDRIVAYGRYITYDNAYRIDSLYNVETHTLWV